MSQQAIEKMLLWLLKIVITILAVAGLYFFVKYFWPLFEHSLTAGIKVALPFFVAYLFGTLLNPMIILLQKKVHLSRTWGALFSLVVFLSIIGGLLYLLVSNLIRELIQLSAVLGTLSENIGNLNINLLLERFRILLINLHLPPDIVQNTVGNVWQVFDVIKNLTKMFLTQLLHIVTSLPNYFILLIITIIASFFFARDFDLIKKSTIKFIPVKWQPNFIRMVASLNKAMFGYLKAVLVLISISGFISLIGLTILGVSYAHILAVVIALFDLLPVLGPGSLYIPWSIWLFISGNLRLGIGLLVLYGIIVVVRQLLEPKIVGQSIGLHPLTTLMALYFGLSLFGFWGIILGPAIVIAYKAFFDEQKAGT